jgi:hypothetical protein
MTHRLWLLALTLPLAGCPLDSRVELGRDTVTTDAGDGETAGTADTAVTGGSMPDARMTGQNGGAEDAAVSVPTPDAAAMILDPDAASVAPPVPDAAVIVPDAAVLPPVPDAAIVAPPECVADAVRDCVVDCIPAGAQRCEAGVWGECTGAIDCTAPNCADNHRAECPLPVCFPNQTHLCHTGCEEGYQGCVDGQWGECVLGRAACGIPDCALAAPADCPDVACSAGDQRLCVDDCLQGRQLCDGGAWGVCLDQIVRCDDPACEARFPEACPNTPVCPDDAFRPCTDGCFEGMQICALGAWGACSNERVRCGDAACAAEHPVECP